MKNTVKNILVATAAITTLGLMAPETQASMVWTGGGVGNDWTTAGNWDTGVPGAGEDVTIGAGYTVDVTTDLGVTLGKLDLGNATTALNIHSGGTLTATGSFSSWPAGNVNIQGTFNWGSSTYATGGSITVSGSGLLTNNGGNAWIQPNFGTQDIALIGSDASITGFTELGDFNGNNDVNFNLTPGATGINAIQAGTLSLQGSADSLTVDLSNYNFDTDSLTLFSFTTLQDDFDGNVTVTGASSYTLNYNATSITLDNLVAPIPEPSTLALLTAGLGTLMAVRRRKIRTTA